MQRFHDKSGLSLVELLIVIAILGIIMGGLQHVLGTFLDSYSYAEKKKNLLYQVRNVMEHMVRFVEATDDIVTPGTLGEDRLEVSERLLDTYDNTSHAYAIDGDGFLDADNDADGLINEDASDPREYVTFSVDKTVSTNWKLIETRPDYSTPDTVDTTSGQVLCEKVVDFTCSRLTNYMVEIRLALDNGEGEVSLSTRAISRLLFMERRLPKAFGGGEAEEVPPALYIADGDNSRIRKVDGATQIITTVAGNGSAGYSGDGVLATDTKLNKPNGICLDGAGNLYIADTENSRIRKVDATTQIISTIAGCASRGYSGDDGPAIEAMLNKPAGVWVDQAGNVYIADRDNHRVRKVGGATQIITTVAGNGSGGYSGDGVLATATKLNKPQGICLDGAGNLYIADKDNSRIRKVDGVTQIITTVAGNGSAGYSGDDVLATDTKLNKPNGICLDGAGNLYIADTENSRIRKVDATTQIISTIAGCASRGYSGDDGPAIEAMLNKPAGVRVGQFGSVYIADRDNHRVREVGGATQIITTVAGNGSGGYSGDGVLATATKLNKPQDLWLFSSP